MNENIIEEIEAEGFEAGMAIATDAEIAAGAACGQIAILTEGSVEADQ